MRSPLSAALSLVLLLGLAACGGPRETTVSNPTTPEPAATQGPPAYEVFDPGPYEVEPAEASAEMAHDVPPTLMEGSIEQAVSEGPRTVQGYRIQVYSSPNKASAESVRDDANQWWRVAGEDPDALELLPEGLPVEIDFNQPYYRVRVGAFEYRREAEGAMRVVQRRFPEAFIVPDVVTLGG